MDIEKLAERLGQEAYGSDIEDLLLESATALSTLQAENAQLRADLEYEREHANAYHEECGQWEAENEKLRAELNDLKDKWDKYQPREHWETLNELCENLHDELEQVKAERDAAIDCCSGYCATCRFVKDCAKHDMNDAAPIRWYYGDCEDWEWRGQKED